MTNCSGCCFFSQFLFCVSAVVVDEVVVVVHVVVVDIVVVVFVVVVDVVVVTQRDSLVAA